MHRIRIRSAAVSALALALLLASGCRRDEADADGRIAIAASIAPLADFARVIGGDRVRVITILPPAANPHTFDLTPDIIAAVGRAKLLILNGAGLEFWADNLRESFGTRGPMTLIATDGMPLLEGGHDGGANPHAWLDPLDAARMVDVIRAAMQTIDPSHRDEYAARAAAFTDSLRALDRTIRDRIGTWKTTSFIAYHATWDYFARRYGLHEAAAIERHPGREASSRELADIVDLMHREGIRAIFAETISPLKPAETLAGETGARIAVLDPIGGPASARSYLSLMRWNLARMDGVMR